MQKEKITFKEETVSKEESVSGENLVSKEEFTSYEYKELNVKEEEASFYLDCYKNFGWQQDENFLTQKNYGKRILRLKRNRKIVNKAELTRLQRHFEANIDEISKMKKNSVLFAKKWTWYIAGAGTAFMAGSVFAVTASSPVIWLCVVLAIPGFAGWISPYFIYRKLKDKNRMQAEPYINQKYEEIYEICEKGHALL